MKDMGKEIEYKVGDFFYGKVGVNEKGYIKIKKIDIEKEFPYIMKNIENGETFSCMDRYLDNNFDFQEHMIEINKDIEGYDNFIKADSNKSNLAILFDTGNALSQVADVMQFGAEKYSRKNWSKVDDKERYISAPLRHMLAYSQGEKIDSESNKHHLAHAICSLLFLLEIELKEEK